MGVLAAFTFEGGPNTVCEEGKIHLQPCEVAGVEVCHYVVAVHPISCYQVVLKRCMLWTGGAAEEERNL